MYKHHSFFVFCLLLLGVLTLASCKVGNQGVIFRLGFSTPEGNDIWIQDVVVNDSWGTPGGGLACCWEESGRNSVLKRHTLPKKIHIQWLDESLNVVFKANVVLKSGYEKRARNLPGYTVKRSGEKEKGSIYIIVGMAEDGQVTVWLSNTASSRNKTGRVLEVIGRAQAVSEPWVPPER